jgi:hypothetical protein
MDTTLNLHFALVCLAGGFFLGIGWACGSSVYSFVTGALKGGRK